MLLRTSEVVLSGDVAAGLTSGMGAVAASAAGVGSDPAYPCGSSMGSGATGGVKAA